MELVWVYFASLDLTALFVRTSSPASSTSRASSPVGYAVFAVALGIAAGALLRRTPPAMAITIGVFTFLRLVIGQDLRSHDLTAVTIINKFGHHMRTPAGSYWLVSQGLVGSGGQLLSTRTLGSGVSINGVPVSEMPSACQALAFQTRSN
jgi:hypothetical protein